MAFSVERFEFGAHEDEWNVFINSARNSTFLFDRNYMDYHKERFSDHSILIKDEKNKIVGCFPAHEADGEIRSHGGLTYGSFILEKEQKLTVTIEIYRTILRYYFDHGLPKIIYKAFPRLYNDLQTDEIEYCLFLSNARLFRKDTSIAVDRAHRIMYAGNIRREAQKAVKSGVTIREEEQISEFWKNILVPNLLERFGVNPVHSVEEMMLLKSRFPTKIRFYSARSITGELLAGTVIFVMNNLVHCQYISASGEGRENGALNLLFTSLLDEYFVNYRFFDFGTTNERDGTTLNRGLLGWKERFGGRSYSHDFYTIETKNWLSLLI